MNKRVRRVVYLIMFFALSSACNKQQKQIETGSIIGSQIDTINIPKFDNEEFEQENLSQYFESNEIVELETRKECLIGSIGRLILFADSMLLFDATTDFFYLFEQGGKFLRKYQNRGKGPGQYIQAMDIAYDENLKQVIVLCDIPRKLIKYSLGGAFIMEKSLPKYYENISITKDYLYLLNTNFDDNIYYSGRYNIDDLSLVDESLVKPELSVKLSGHGTHYPLTNKSRGNYFLAPFDYNVYQIENDKIGVKYYLNFERNEIPFDLSDEQISNLFTTVKDFNYGGYLSNFREMEHFIFFKFEPNKLVVYSKREKESKVLNGFHNDFGGFDFNFYFSHDGDDDFLIDHITSNKLEQMKRVLKSGQKLALDSLCLDIVKRKPITDNPILIKYRLREQLNTLQ